MLHRPRPAVSYNYVFLMLPDRALPKESRENPTGVFTDLEQRMAEQHKSTLGTNFTTKATRLHAEKRHCFARIRPGYVETEFVSSTHPTACRS